MERLYPLRFRSGFARYPEDVPAPSAVWRRGLVLSDDGIMKQDGGEQAGYRLFLTKILFSSAPHIVAGEEPLGIPLFA